MSFAKSLHDAIDSLFPNRTVLLLRRSLEEEKQRSASEILRVQELCDSICEMYRERIEDLKSEIRHHGEYYSEALRFWDSLRHGLREDADYFRGRADRLELKLIPEVPPPVVKERRPTRANTEAPRPTSWTQVQEQHAAKLREEIAEEKRKKEATPDAAKQAQPASPKPEAKPPEEKINSGASGTGRTQPEERSAAVRPESTGSSGVQSTA